MKPSYICKKPPQSPIVDESFTTLPKNTLTGLQRNGAVFCILMKQDVLMSLRHATSLSDDPQTLNSSHSTLLKTVKHGGASIVIWACFLILRVGPIYRIPWITLSTLKYLKRLVTLCRSGNALEMSVSTRQPTPTHQ